MKFKPDGTVETDANGFSGPQCVSRVDEIIKSLDPQAELKDRSFKKEFYGNVQNQTANTNRVQR